MWDLNDINAPESEAVQAEREIWEDLVRYEQEPTQLATEADAHLEWHRNTGIPVGTPGCPQDACHGDEYDYVEQPLVTFKRLRNGAWGITGPTAVLQPGNEVVVTKKSGETSRVFVSRVLWSGDGKAIATTRNRRYH